ncbi:MAG TPA: aldolase/citrate lyase family protein [Chloroflexota bacterium]|nr:aldolase/citrate lyase family protein [Chloroflexota bacterium]
MRGERLRARMHSDQVILNVGLTFHSPAVVEMLCQSAADDIFLDAEHGAISEGQCEDMIRAADAHDKPVIIRVPANQDHVILRYLDIGASGLIIPHVSSPDDAARAVAAMKYGPEGHRSIAGGRSSAYGARESAVEYMRRANRETVVIGLFEDIHALPSVKEIFAVEGLDGLIVGPNDLAASMGLPGQPWHAEVQAVVDEVIAAARAIGKPTGLPAGSAAQAAQHIARGCRFITLSVSALIIGGMNQLAKDLG